tara:strand:+ start:342 stop:518 length:177 start_codon:yes stop_codon:yes gene_type:complete
MRDLCTDPSYINLLPIIVDESNPEDSMWEGELTSEGQKLVESTLQEYKEKTGNDVSTL